LKIKYHKKIIAICALLSVQVSPVFSIEEVAEDPPEITEPLPEEKIEIIEKEPFFTFLDQPQQTISSRFKSFVKGTDEFFANEKVFYETTGSYIKLTGEFVQLERGEQGYYSDLKVKLKLPLTQKNLSLLVESNPAGENELDKALEPTPQKALEEKDYFAGLQTTIGDEKKWQLKPSVGVKLSDPIDYYARFRLVRDIPLDDGMFKFNETLYWFDSRGWESDTSGEFNLHLTEDVLFRSTTGVNWKEETDISQPRQLFSLTQKISDRRSIAYQTGFYGNNEPITDNTYYLVAVHYRQNIHSDYLFMDLIPQVTYHKENDYHSEFSLTIRMEMVFRG